MRRRKDRERRHTWLQRELEASGIVVNQHSVRKIALPPSTTPFHEIAVRPAVAPTPRRRKRPQEVRVVN